MLPFVSAQRTRIGREYGTRLGRSQGTTASKGSAMPHDTLAPIVAGRARRAGVALARAALII
ncbi:hypothetical protein, partial [Nitrospirillum viridazoti]|uniref:hypothetical protein n=1 Tax=Nitrospirillum viridazoti TaxID=3144925 RepID=UPI0019D71D9D